MKKDVEKKLAKSLTAETTEIIPYLPYLLQDLWELGSGPEDIKELILRYIPVSEKTKILDLACGKGAVSVKLAAELGCHVKGIDIIPEFIEYARKKAVEYSVERLCCFEVGDINQSVANERCYDIVVFGAAGDVLGDYAEAILKLKSTINKDGFIFIDDAYSNYESYGEFLSRDQWLRIFMDTGVRLIAEKPVNDKELLDINRFNQECIIKRANELKAMHPEKSSIFEGYIKSQQAECDQLESEITGVTWLLQSAGE